MLTDTIEYPPHLIGRSVVAVDDVAVETIVKQPFNNRTGPAVVREEKTSAIDPAIPQ